MCAGYDNGDIKLFDLRNMSVRWETNIKNGVSCFSPSFLAALPEQNYLHLEKVDGMIHPNLS